MKTIHAFSALLLGTSSSALAFTIQRPNLGTRLLKANSPVLLAPWTGNVWIRAPTTARFMTSDESQQVEEFIKSEINSSKVMSFTKSYCPHSKATKELFTSLGVDFKFIDIDLRDDGSDIQANLAEMTGQKTVPNTFINGKHFGGNDKAQAANSSGELQKLLGM